MLSLILFQNDVYWSTNILRMTFVVVCLTVNYNDRIWSVMIIIIIVVWVMSLRFETERGRKRNERKEVTSLFWCTCGLDKFCIEKENVRRLILNMVDENHQCLSSSCAYIWLEEYVKIFSMVSFYIPSKGHLSLVFCSISLYLLFTFIDMPSSSPHVNDFTSIMCLTLTMIYMLILPHRYLQWTTSIVYI